MFAAIKRFFKRIYNRFFSRSRYYPDGMWDEYEKRQKPRR